MVSISQAKTKCIPQLAAIFINAVCAAQCSVKGQELSEAVLWQPLECLVCKRETCKAPKVPVLLGISLMASELGALVLCEKRDFRKAFSPEKFSCSIDKEKRQPVGWLKERGDFFQLRSRVCAEFSSPGEAKDWLRTRETVRVILPSFPFPFPFF